MYVCAGERAAAALREVDEGVVPWFREAAKQLLEDYTDPEEAMARALAKVTGHTKLQVDNLFALLCHAGKTSAISCLQGFC